MAKATSHIEKRPLTQAEQDTRALMEILGAVAQHKEAVLTFLDILGEMHEAGLLQIAQGVLKNRQQIGAIGITQMNKSGAQRIIKNAVSTMQFFAKLDSARLNQLFDAVVQGVEHAQPAERPSVLGLVGKLRDPEVSTSLSLVMNFLQGMGEALPRVQ